MKKINAYSFLLFYCIVILYSCSIPAKTTSPVLQEMPENYGSPGKDSLNMASISRELFFHDETLLGLIDTALKNNPDLQIVLQRVAASRAYLTMGRGLTRPSLDAVVSAGVDKFGDYTMNGLGNYDMNLSPNINKDQRIPLNMPDMFLGFRSSWEADIWGKLSDKKKAAYARYLSSEKGRLWTTTQLVAHVASLYYELLALDKEEEIILNNIELQENALQVVIAQKAGGRATELAVQQFNAQLLGTKSFLHVIRQSIVETENALSALTGKFNQQIKRHNKIVELELPTIVNTGVPTQLLINRPDIQEAELLLTAAGAELEASRKAFLPSLNITAYTALNSFNPQFLVSPKSLAYGILGGLVTPVLSKNMLKGNYELATAAQSEAFYQYQKNILNAYQEVQTQLKGIEHYKQIYVLKSEETKSLQAAVSTSKELYRTGYASYLEVITAQRGVLDAELESIKSKRTVFIRLIDLYRALGGGWN
ncbi:MAG: TolC family protein [Sediminibacterium sp.]